jgi:flagellar biosynthetic protein FlhB
MIAILAPIMVPIMLMGVISNLLQSGWLVSSEPLKPKLENLSPLKGLKRLGSKRSLVELVKSILKILIVGWVGYTTLRGLMPEMPPLMDCPVGDIFRWVCGGVVKIAYRTLFAFIILSILDFFFQRYEFMSGMKMTKQEIKDEHRQSDGDPHVKSKIRSIQLRTALQRMMKNVHKADVVITNPTEIAVALQYDPETMSAPLVLAKGKNLIAARIRQLAAENDIPLVENKPLAQAMYKAVEIGREIPGNFYQAVAEILAYVYRLKDASQGVYK